MTEQVHRTQVLNRKEEHEQVSPVHEPGWRKVFGKARPEEVAAVDAIVEKDLGRIDPGEWQ